VCVVARRQLLSVASSALSLAFPTVIEINLMDEWGGSVHASLHKKLLAGFKVGDALHPAAHIHTHFSPRPWSALRPLDGDATMTAALRIWLQSLRGRVLSWSSHGQARHGDVLVVLSGLERVRWVVVVVWLVCTWRGRWKRMRVWYLCCGIFAVSCGGFWCLCCVMWWLGGMAQTRDVCGYGRVFRPAGRREVSRHCRAR
jgi:hypothetical protein